MTQQAKQRITFTRLIDGRSLNFTLSPNLAINQVKSTTGVSSTVSYLPNYASTSLDISPILSVTGHTGTQVSGTCTWYVNGVAITSSTAGYTIGTTAPFALSVKCNSDSPRLIKCSYTYVDDNGGNATVEATITLTCVANGGENCMATIDPSATAFKNIANANTQTTILTANLVRAGAYDTTNVSYVWYKANAAGGWDALADTAGKYTGTNTQKLTVYPNGVDSIDTFRVGITDTETNSNTQGKVFYAIQSITDESDPYDMDLTPAKGTEFAATDTAGKPVQIDITQGTKTWAAADYDGKTLGFYRETSSMVKDTTWAPAAADFTGWTWSADNKEFTRAYSAGSGTDANRTITIKREHLTSDTQTSFVAFLEF